MKNLFANSIEIKPTETETSAEATPATAPDPVAAPAYELAQAELPETCDIPYQGPVTIIKVPTANALQRSVSARPPRELVYETEDTAIFEDGKVLTTQLENVGTHLNAVGWSTNPMRIMGSGVRPAGSSTNLAWRSGEAPGKEKKKKRRRRRG